MNYILFDNFRRSDLLPLTFTRPVCEIRIGILTIREKWEAFLESKTSTLTEDYLSIKYPIIKEKINILINGSICPNKELVGEVVSLKPSQVLIKDQVIIAMNVSEEDLDMIDSEKEGMKEIETNTTFNKINNTWDIFALNGEELRNDFKLVTRGRTSGSISSTNRMLGKNIFIEEGAKVENTVLNSETGPIYIGKETEIMEGVLIRGPFALCDHGIVKMGTRIYGPTTFGPYSKIGGEVNNSVVFGYSNKAHDGFLGSSVIGEWCNFGADTNTSNLKNIYDVVKLWNYPDKTFIDTGRQFCGLIMGDYTKCGINTMFNTGTVVGVSSNIFGSGFQRNFIPSFAWGGTHGYSLYRFDKAVEAIKRMYDRRGFEFDDIDKEILRNVFDMTRSHDSI